MTLIRGQEYATVNILFLIEDETSAIVFYSPQDVDDVKEAQTGLKALSGSWIHISFLGSSLTLV